MERLSLAALNRATLARQSLLERTGASVEAVIAELAGMQSQAPGPPYPGLWSRVDGFAFAALERALTARTAVRIVTLRGTVHLHTAEDARMLRPFTQPVIERQLRSNHARKVDGLDAVEAEALARERLAAGPATGPELAAALARRWPEAPADALANVARALLPLVQIPPRGLWRASAPPTYALLDEWTGHPLREPHPTEVVRRYLAAFGPASVKDAQAWCGATRLKAAFVALGDELIRLEGPDGTELFDLVDAPRPPAETPAPVRLLGEWDNLLIGYADRSRIIDEAHRAAIFTPNGIMPGTVLVDGRVAATYRVRAATSKVPSALTVTPLVSLSAGARRAITAEARGLAEAMGDEAVIAFADTD